ncbi:MAG: sigma-70 family RNA polymerase sigma factor [Myxococcota bacterium]
MNLARAMELERDPIAEEILAGRFRSATAMCAEAHGTALGRLCMALLGNQAEAEEAVQEALLSAHTAMAQFRASGTVRGWLMTIARRTCAQRLERRTRRRQQNAQLRDVHEAPGPDHLADVHRRAECVRGALAELKPTDRELIVLRYQAGLSFREVAAALEISEAAARQRGGRALRRLRDLLADEVG